ncbi:hypothetical protein CPB86DRAFT_417992 [Serendipita vermifera]|nr:hypothetical protein CPB86DRAFT_417992 [Serendipita vermifera]
MVPMAVVCVARIGWAWAESEAQIWRVRADPAVMRRRCYGSRRRGEMPVWRLLVQLALQPMDKAPSCLALEELRKPTSNHRLCGIRTRIVFIFDGRFGQCFQCGLALHRVMGRLRGLLLLLLLDELLELLLLELLLLTTESALALLCEVSGSHELLFLDVDEISDALGFEEGGLAALLGVVLLKGELEVAGAHGCRSSRR